MKRPLTTYISYLIGIYLFFAAQLLYAQQLNIISGSYTKENKAGIHLISINLNNTNVQIKELDSVVSNPSYLFFSKKEQILYGVSEGRGKENALAVSWKFNSKKLTLSFINSSYTGGDHPCHLFVDTKNKILYTANYSGGNLSTIPIYSKGMLGEATQTIQHNGSSVHSKYQRSPHVHQVIYRSKQSDLVVADLGTDEIKFYSINNKKSPRPIENNIETVKTTPGAGPRHVSFHPVLPIMYVLEEISGMLAVYEKKEQTWDLLQRINLYDKDDLGEKASAHIAISKDAKHIYCSNRGENNSITHFTIQENGRVNQPTIYPLQNKWPRHFTLDYTETYLAIAFQHSHQIQIFKRDTQTGALNPLDIEIKIPNPTYVEFIDLN
ncbi:MAG: lactonase family protein [Hydrotalea sp.]|nr:lactonase family protein [Hydrotalea sp.]